MGEMPICGASHEMAPFAEIDGLLLVPLQSSISAKIRTRIQGCAWPRIQTP